MGGKPAVQAGITRADAEVDGPQRRARLASTPCSCWHKEGGRAEGALDGPCALSGHPAWSQCAATYTCVPIPVYAVAARDDG